jgi:hypothetical protein
MSTREIIGSPDGWQLSDSSPQKLRSLLDDFDAALAAVDVDINSVLAPGIAESEVRSRFQSIGLVAPDELVVWFGWHNGLGAAPGKTWVGKPPFMSQASLDWMTERYLYDIEEAVPAGVWVPGWVCLDDTKDVAAFCSGDAAGSPAVRVFDTELLPEELSPGRQVLSLCTLLSWWVEAIETGMATPTTATGDLAWDYDNKRLMELDKGTMLLV